jgi:hypothetical protein
MLIYAPGCSLFAGRAVSPQESRTFHSNQLIIEVVFTKAAHKIKLKNALKKVPF